MVVGHSLHSKKMRLRCLPNTVWKNEKFTLNLKKFRENSVVSFSTKGIDFTEFLRKKMRVNFCNFHTVPYSPFVAIYKFAK